MKPINATQLRTVLCNNFTGNEEEWERFMAIRYMIIIQIAANIMT